MALADITNAILAQARQQAAEIVKEGARRADEKTAYWQSRIDARKAELIASAQRKADTKVQQSHFLLSAKQMQQVLQRKHDILDSIFAQAIHKLGALSDKEYSALMSKLIAQLPRTGGTLVSVAGKEALLKKALTTAQTKHFSVSKETVPGVGGFVFQSDMTHCDNRFEVLVQQARQQSTTAIASLVF